MISSFTLNVSFVLTNTWVFYRRLTCKRYIDIPLNAPEFRQNVHFNRRNCVMNRAKNPYKPVLWEANVSSVKVKWVSGERLPVSSMNHIWTHTHTHPFYIIPKSVLRSCAFASNYSVQVPAFFTVSVSKFLCEINYGGFFHLFL